MTDRESRYPGRYRAVMSASDVSQMQAGNQFSITLVRDDDPIDPGTPFSKETILPDSLVEYFGIDPEQINTLADFLWEMVAQGKANSYDISIIQETLENLSSGGGGSDEIEAIKAELAGLRQDYEGNEYESAGEAVRGATMELNVRLQKLDAAVDENSADINQIDEQIGNIETALDSILAIQNQLIGGVGA